MWSLGTSGVVTATGRPDSKCHTEKVAFDALTALTIESESPTLMQMELWAPATLFLLT